MKVETESESRNNDGARGGAPKLTHIRALVVEDEPASSLLINEALAAAGIEAVTLKKGAEVGPLFQDEKFDVILLDVGARSEDGTELVRKIRGSGFNKKTPVILISDDLRPGALSKGFEAGASLFVYKPFDKAYLMRLIRVTQGTIDHEKRRFRRVAVQTKASVKCADQTAEGETIDVSLNGTLIRASCIFALGSRVEISLYFPAGTHPVVGIGSIMRVMDSNQMGIQFELMPVAESRRLQEYLLSLIAG